MKTSFLSELWDWLILRETLSVSLNGINAHSGKPMVINENGFSEQAAQWQSDSSY